MMGDSFLHGSSSTIDDVFQRVLGDFQDPAGIHRFNPMSGTNQRSTTSPPQNYNPVINPLSTDPMTVVEKDGKYQIMLDVKLFNPRNLQVRAVEDNRIIVEGKYQLAGGTDSSPWKTFNREFTLPSNGDIDQVTTALSKEGVLTIRAPKKTNTPPNLTVPKSATNISANKSYDQHDASDAMSAKSFKSSTSSTSSNYYSNQKKATENHLQNSSSFESCDSGLDSLPRDIKERLMMNESGLSSLNTSNSSSCSSPVSSEAASDMSRYSCQSMNETSDKIEQRPTPAYRSVPKFENQSSYSSPSSTPYRVTSPDPSTPINHYQDSNQVVHQPQNPLPAVSIPINKVPTFGPGCASLGDKCVTVEEKDGKKTVKSESSNVIQEKNGVMQSHEITAKIDEKDGCTARREAVTSIQRQHDDPYGRYKADERAQAKDVNESCIKVLPDGSKVSMKKTSSSSTSHKSFSSNQRSFDEVFEDPFFNSGFSSNFGDLKSLMGRGHSLMSQMSTDSLGSTLSGRSESTDRSSSRMSDTSRSSNRSQDNIFPRSRLSEDRLQGRQFSGLMQDEEDDSFFSRRLTNRPSLVERFPDFADSLADFDEMRNSSFSNFPSMNSDARFQTSKKSFSSNSSFESRFKDF